MEAKDFITEEYNELVVYTNRTYLLLTLSLITLFSIYKVWVLAVIYLNIYFHVFLYSLSILFILFGFWYSLKKNIRLIFNKNGIWKNKINYEWDEIKECKFYKVLFVNFMSFELIKENKTVEISFFWISGNIQNINNQISFLFKINSDSKRNIDSNAGITPILLTEPSSVNLGNVVKKTSFFISLIIALASFSLLLFIIGRLFISEFSLYPISESRDKFELNRLKIDSMIQSSNGDVTTLYFDSILFNNYYLNVNREIEKNGNITVREKYVKSVPENIKVNIDSLVLYFPIAKYPNVLTKISNSSLPIDRFISNIPNEVSQNNLYILRDKNDLNSNKIRTLYSSEEEINKYLDLMKELDSCKEDYNTKVERYKHLMKNKYEMLKYCKNGIAFDKREDQINDYTYNTPDEIGYLNLCTTEIIGTSAVPYNADISIKLFGTSIIEKSDNLSIFDTVPIESFVLSKRHVTESWNPLNFYPSFKKLPIVIINENDINKTKTSIPYYCIFFLRKNSSTSLLNKIKLLYNDNEEFEKYFKYCMLLEEGFTETIFH